MRIRRATANDAAGMLAIYGPVIEHSATSFEAEVPSEATFAGRIDASLARHDWLIMTDGDDILGYAYATPHRQRHAYRYSVETSVYVHPDHHGKGIGRALYESLFESLRALGYHNAYAGITLPNDASVALHHALGFEDIGVFREVGFKYDTWHDVAWLQRPV